MRACPICQKQIPDAALYNKVYCSDKCKYKTVLRAAKINEEQVVENERLCAECGNFTVASKYHRYCSLCSDDVKARLKSESLYQKREVMEPIECRNCGRTLAQQTSRLRRFCSTVCRDKIYNGRSWIPNATRQTVYVRDNWTCQLCNESVDRNSSRKSLSPSLDHVLPCSWTMAPDDSPEGLRLVHHGCNTVRTNKPDFNDALFIKHLLKCPKELLTIPQEYQTEVQEFLDTHV